MLFSGSVWGAGGQEIPKETILKAFFHTVFIYNDSFFCHGILISPSKVLTAAHCLDHIETNMEDLKVIAFKSSREKSYTKQNFFRFIEKLRIPIALCLSGDFLLCIDQFYWPVIENSTQPRYLLQRRLALIRLSVRKIHIHPDFRREGSVHKEDAAVIILKTPFINEFSEDIFSLFKPDSHLLAATTFQEENSSPSDCFTTDGRAQDSIYQQTSLLSFDLFSRSVVDELPEIPLAPAELSISIGVSHFIRLLKAWLFYEQKKEEFIFQVTNEQPWGYSGGPLWCHRPETGLFLRGHAIFGFSRDQLSWFGVKKFDESLHQWIQ